MPQASLPPTNPDDLRRNGVTPETFRTAYQSAPPWEISRPQQEIVRLADADGFLGAILDSGCGTGENAIFLASRGHKVLGVDIVPSAIERAIGKNADRNQSAAFRIHDVLQLASLDERFDTILDSGVFHTFSDADRPVYVASLADALNPGGRLVLMCFSELELREGGPRRVTQDEIRHSFANGWTIHSIVPARFEATLFKDGAQAWLAQIRKD